LFPKRHYTRHVFVFKFTSIYNVMRIVNATLFNAYYRFTCKGNKNS